MLAPSAITIRRPSCEADLILTRIESEPPFYPGLCPSDSVQSAPLYDCWAPNCDDIAPSELRSADGTGDRLCVTKRRKDSLISTTSGPDPRGRYWHRRSVPRICEDTTGSEPGGVGQGGVRVGSGDGGFRRASLTLRRSIDSLLCSLSSPKKSLDQTGLTIEVIQESPLFRRRSKLGQRRKSLDKVQEDIDDDSFFAQSNLSLSLVLTSLKDGCLCAEIPIDELEELPSGHVTIRVRNFNLDVSLTSGEKAAPCFREPREPCYRGSVALPIYVNPSTLQFRLDESKNVVHLEGKIKGCCTRIGSSLSAMELSSQAGLAAAPPPMSTAVAGAGM